MNIQQALATPSLIGIPEATGRERFATLCEDSEALRQAHDYVTDDLCRIGTYLGDGTSRVVYIVDDLVVKAPHPGHHFSLANCYSNLVEVAAYEHNAYIGPVVPCRTVWHQSGIPLVVMEMVDVDADATDMPAWGYEVDCEQVAWSELLDTWAVYDAGYLIYSELPPHLRSLYGEDRFRQWLAETIPAAA